MEIAAILIIVTAALAAAALAAAVGFAARRFAAFALPLHWLALGGAGVGALAGGAVVGGWGQALFAEQIAVSDVLPYMGTIEMREPELFERIETSVIRDGQDGKDPAQVRGNARALVASYVADKIVYLPDDLTYAIFVTTRDMLAYLAEHDDYSICADLALGRYKGDLGAHISPELLERDNANTLRVLNYVPPKKKDETTGEDLPPERAPLMPAEEFSALAAKAFVTAGDVAGIAPEAVDRLLAGEGEPDKTCKLMKGFFDALLAEPVASAAAALRTLSTGERAVGHN